MIRGYICILRNSIQFIWQPHNHWKANKAIFLSDLLIYVDHATTYEVYAINICKRFEFESNLAVKLIGSILTYNLDWWFAYFQLILINYSIKWSFSLKFWHFKRKERILTVICRYTETFFQFNCLLLFFFKKNLFLL